MITENKETLKKIIELGENATAELYTLSKQDYFLRLGITVKPENKQAVEELLGQAKLS